MFDEQPDGDPHGECAAEINRLQSLAENVALDIAKWFANGDRPDEFKLKEWAEALDRDAVAKAFDWMVGTP